MSARVAAPTTADILQAAERIKTDIRRTPLHPWDEGAGMWLKLESLQPTGSFKVRGAANHVRAVASDVKGVITASSGNHGQAVAYIAARLGLPAAVVVPETVTTLKAAGIRRLGAQVIPCGTTATERYALAERLAAERDFHLVPSYDDPLIVAGQGTTALEILEQAPELGVVVVPTGGGGLISGVALVVKSLRPDVRVVGVEPAAVARYAASRAAGTRVAVPSVATVADGLRVQEPGLLPWMVTSLFVDEFVSVDDDRILNAVRRLYLQGHLVVEPSGAAAVAALLAGLVPQRPAVAVVSGGNLEPGLLATLLSSPAES